MTLSVPDLLEAITGVVPNGAPLHVPEISGNEWDYVKECLDTGWVSSVGSYVTAFEKRLTEVTGAGYAVATSSGTSALHTCLLVAGVQPGDEVIVPNLTFVATANAVAYCGAAPHLADSNERTLGICPAKLKEHLAAIVRMEDGKPINKETGRRIAAVVCMHTFGHPIETEALCDVCDEFSIPLIEDAAESLGSLYKGRHTGTDGLLSALSFNGNKIVTTGGGGAVLTNDEGLAARARHLTTTAKASDPWEFFHDEVGYNYRMSNVAAAIGCAQLERLDEFVAKKRQLAGRYRDALAAVADVDFFDEPKDCRSNYWLNVIILKTRDLALRNEVLSALNDAGIMSRPAWRPMADLPMFRHARRMNLSVSEGLYQGLINLPSNPMLMDA